jgi:hypothetical protein
VTVRELTSFVALLQPGKERCLVHTQIWLDIHAAILARLRAEIHRPVEDLLLHNHRRAHRHALIEVDDVGIGQPKAA